MRTCSKCKQDRLASEFHKGQARCKVCQRAISAAYYAANRERILTSVSARTAANRDEINSRRREKYAGPYRRTRKNWNLKRYGLTVADYDAMVEAQGDACALCRQVPTTVRALHVDHDHVTGRVRGLLCHGCNTGIGSLREDPELLKAAAAYLLSFVE